jgi:hypothetical protein
MTISITSKNEPFKFVDNKLLSKLEFTEPRIFNQICEESDVFLQNSYEGSLAK